MGGATCTIGGVSFTTLTSTPGRYCRECCADAPTRRLSRFNPPGVKGNFTIRGLQNGQKIYCKLIYLDTYPNLVATYNTDAAAWFNTPVTIVDEAGSSYTNCNLVSMTRSKPTVPKVAGGSAFCTIEALAIFEVDS